MPEPSPATPHDTRNEARHHAGQEARRDDRRPIAPPASGIRSFHLWVSLLPALAVALIGVATLGYLIGLDPAPGGTALVLALAAIAVAGVLIGAGIGARAATRRVHESLAALRTASTRGRDDLQRIVEQVHKGERPPLRGPGRPPIDGSDEFALLAYDMSYARHAAEEAVVKASSLTPASGSDQRVEVFVNLARRLQSLVHREIQLLDELENQVEDPDLLKGLFQVDHLATRIRRHAENLAVLGGAVSRRQWSRPVTLTEVLRSAVAEVEQYSRVKLVPPIEGNLQGHAVADVIHLVAELVENATMFSAPNSQVLLRAQKVTAGLAIEVDDRGLGMALDDQQRLNSVLADPSQIDIGDLLRDGRIGLYVVATLARRHHAVARLQTNIYGGIQAVVILPKALLGDGPKAIQQHVPAQQQAPALPQSPALPLAPAQPQHAHEQPPARQQPPVPHQPAHAQQGGYAQQPAHAQHAAPESMLEADTEISPPRAVASTSPAQPPAQPPALSPTQPHGQQPTAPPRHDSFGLPFELPPAGNGEFNWLNDWRSNPPDSPDPPTATGTVARASVAPVLPDALPPPAPSYEPLPPAGPAGESNGAPPHQAPDVGARPKLPQRRRQSHLAPELRDAPPPRHDEQAGHDPGLMAAFQRGFNRAEPTDEDNGPISYTDSNGGPS